MDDRSREIVGNTAAPVHVHAAGSADLADDSHGPSGHRLSVAGVRQVELHLDLAVGRLSPQARVRWAGDVVEPDSQLPDVA